MAQKEELLVNRRELFHVIGSVPALTALTAGSAVAHGQETQQDHAHMAQEQSAPPKDLTSVRCSTITSGVR